MRFIIVSKGDFSDTATIAFDLSGNSYAKGIQSQMPEDAVIVEDPHITLLHLGKLQELSNSVAEDAMKRALEEFSNVQAPILGEFTGSAIFDRSSTNDGQPIVLLYDSPQLPYLRVRLHQFLQQKFHMQFAQDHGLIPHVTLAYVTTPVVIKDSERQKLQFGSIWLYWGDNHTEFLLAGMVIEKGDVASGIKRVKAGNIAGLAKHLAKKYGGDPGFFTKCDTCEELVGYDEDTRHAICAKAHKLAIGIWPGEGRKAKVKKAKEASYIGADDGDWMKSLPGYKDEVEITQNAAKNRKG